MWLHKCSMQICESGRTQMLPHAENLTADHHSHVTVPLKTLQKIISHLDNVVIATVFPWCNLLITHNVKILNNSVYSKSLNLLLLIVHHYAFYIVKSFPGGFWSYKGKEQEGLSLLQDFFPLGGREHFQLEAGLVDEYYTEIKIGLPYLQKKRELIKMLTMIICTAGTCSQDALGDTEKKTLLLCSHFFFHTAHWK